MDSIKNEIKNIIDNAFELKKIILITLLRGKRRSQLNWKILSM